MKERIRGTFMTDRDSWAHCHELLKEKGYPQGTLGHYLTDCVHTLTLQLEHTDCEQLQLLLEIKR